MKNVIIYVSYLWTNLIPVDYWFSFNFNSVYSFHIYIYKVERKPISKFWHWSTHEYNCYKNSKLYIFNKICTVSWRSQITMALPLRAKRLYYFLLPLNRSLRFVKLNLPSVTSSVSYLLSCYLLVWQL